MYYTKYRPQTFAEIQRPNEIADALMQQIKTGKTVHAYLFTGPRGVGKTTMARLLAKALTCGKLTKEGDVCGQCEFCLGVQNGSLIDLVEIDAASNRGIDDIRDLREKVKLMPAQGKKKVYIIDEVHMLTNEAFNALLKTLEEPPKHAVFILCTTEFHKVPETIKSRCQVFKFKRPGKAQIVEKLRRIAEAESVAEKIADEEFERVAVLAGGAFRDAETILQQFIEGGRHGGQKAGSTATYSEFIVALCEGEPKKSLIIINANYDDGVDLAVWTDGLLRYLRDVLYLAMGFSDDFFALAEDDLADRKHLAQAISKDWFVNAVEAFNQAQNDLKTYSIPQLALDLAVAKLTFCLGLGKANGLPTSGGSSSPTPLSKVSNKVNPKVESSSRKEPDSAKDDRSAKDSDQEKLVAEQAAEGTLVKSEESDLVVVQNTQIERDAQTVAIALEIIENRWKEVVSNVNKLNNSVGALVKSGKPVQIIENAVVLEVSYKFHKERLESTTNKKLVEKVLEEVFGNKLGLKCVVCQKLESKKEGETGDLTDLNIRVPQDMVITSKTVVTDVFDGGLPI